MVLSASDDEEDDAASAALTHRVRQNEREHWLQRMACSKWCHSAWPGISHKAYIFFCHLCTHT
jgi:hypothetical protein